MRNKTARHFALVSCITAPLALGSHSATAAADSSNGVWSVHGQMTLVEQYHPAFRSPFRGHNSLDPGSRGNETIDATLFAGIRLLDGVEAYANPEIDQGFGLSNTLGVAGFPSGEAYKVGKASPYFRLHRLFLRLSFDLGGEMVSIADGANQIAGSRTADNFVITAGKFSVTDVFDTNSFAHDPKGDFLNWAIIDSGAYDYAADAWGYTYGVAAEWTRSWWTLRAGLFDLSRVPNTTELVRGFGQYELVAEAEERHTLRGQDGKVRLLAFVNRGRMGSYRDAVALGLATHSVPDTALVRQPAFRPGIALNAEQQIDDELGAFARLSFSDGSEEAFEFTEINESLALGLALKGARWARPDDTVGAAFVVNGISKSAQAYFAAGGIGILIGDSALPRYATENVFEAYYSATLTDQFAIGADYQLVVNPAYSAVRGPVSILGARLHASF